jgi:cellobiose phosphorylase
MAFAHMGDADRAWELLSIINPVSHARSAPAAATYKVEPYVVAADVYAVAPHIGRGGWTWYTGAAGWMYRLILESLLGITREGDRLRLAPCLAPHQAGFKASYRHGGSMYRIEVTRAARGEEARLAVDGVEQTQPTIRLIDDGGRHAVHLRLGT